MSARLRIGKHPSTALWEVTLHPSGKVLQQFDGQPEAQRFANQILSSGAGRWRCCIAGCNPKLANRAEAEAHKFLVGHRIAAWPVRSKEGKARAKARNRNGYYDKYNVGYKSRAYSYPYGFHEDAEHPMSEEAVQG